MIIRPCFINFSGFVCLNGFLGGHRQPDLDATVASATVNLGSGAQAKTIQIGNSIGPTSVTITAGTGPITFTGRLKSTQTTAPAILVQPASYGTSPMAARDCWIR